MLGRLLYVLILLGVILSGGFLLHIVAEEPGTLTLDYGDRIYELTLLDAAIVLVVGIILLMVAVIVIKFLIAILRFILGDADALGGFFSKRRERKGLEALSRGMVALAEGDAKTAQKQAKIAEQKLMKPELTRLLNAQAAVLAGDDSRAETYFKALMAEPGTAFVGAQGLLENALSDNDSARAMKLAQHASDLKPKDQGTLETLYMLQSQKFDWEAARKTLKAQRKAGHVPKLEANRREAGLLLAQSQDAESLGETDHARALAVDAAKLDPTNVEAVSTAVHQLLASGSRRAASKLVTDAWRAGPHPALAAAYAAIEPDESPAARRRRFEALFSLHPNHDESRFLRAELALVAEDWSDAKAAIQDLRETEPSARSCAIMAAIARGEGEPDHVIRGWLARALGAPRNDATDSEISHAAMLPLLIEPTPEPAPDNEPEDQEGADHDTADEAHEEADTVDVAAGESEEVSPDLAAIRPDMAQTDAATEAARNERRTAGG